MVLDLGRTEITDDGCATLAAAFDSGALPALIEDLEFDDIPASAAAKRAVSEAMARSFWHDRRVEPDGKVVLVRSEG